MKQIYIYGASGHGLVVADIARACGYEEVIFVDDWDNKFQSFEEIKSNTNIPIALGIGSNKTRKKLFEKAKLSGFELATLVHPNSIVSPSTAIGEGSVVMPLVVINAKAQIGNGIILNSGCVVEHECVIEDFVHISPAVALAGNVRVGELTHIGIGSNVIQGISIGANCIVGAGSVVVKNIKNNKKAYGNPCQEIGENE
ncbi:MAG: acetyltransferase [Sulfurovaceae bacterium]|jgi:UDP-N-acetylbacillosamine N-acetyltransferase